MKDLAAWLTAVWDEEARLAKRAADALTTPEIDNYGHLTVPSAWMVARIAADRKILELHHPDREADTWYWLERECAGCGRRWHGNTPPGTPPTVIGPERGCPTIRLLASPYKGREGWQEEWEV